MSTKGTIAVVVVTLLIGIGGTAGFFYVKDAADRAELAEKQREAASTAAADAAQRAAKAEQERQAQVNAAIEASVALGKARQAEREAAEREEKAEKARVKKRDKRIAAEIARFAKIKYASHQTDASLLTWDYNDHEVVETKDSPVQGGEIRKVVRIRAVARGAIMKSNVYGFPTSTWEMDFSGEGELLAYERIAETK